MECPFCHAENLEGTATCVACGQDLTAVENAGALDELAAAIFGRLADVPLNEPLALAPDASVADAVALMRERRHGSVQVVEAGVPIGIFTESDLLRRVDPGADLATLALSGVMTADPECFRPRASVAQALNGMAVRGYRHLPVVESGRALSGFVSVRGLLAHIRDQVAL